MAANIQHSSESVEHYTPPSIVEPIRASYGGAIDTDPASCEVANRLIVKARRFYTAADNGLAFPMSGRCMVNPPGGLLDAYGRMIIRANKAKKRPPCTESGACGLAPGHDHPEPASGVRRFWIHAVEERNAGVAEVVTVVLFSLEALTQLQDLPEAPTRLVTCIPRERVRYMHVVEDRLVVGAAPTHGSAIALIPARGWADGREQVRRFVREMEHLGNIINRPTWA